MSPTTLAWIAVGFWGATFVALAFYGALYWRHLRQVRRESESRHRHNRPRGGT